MSYQSSSTPVFADAVEILWQPFSGGGGVSMHMSACTTGEIFGIYFSTEGTSCNR